MQTNQSHQSNSIRSIHSTNPNTTRNEMNKPKTGQWSGGWWVCPPATASNERPGSVTLHSQSNTPLFWEWDGHGPCPSNPIQMWGPSSMHWCDPRPSQWTQAHNYSLKMMSNHSQFWKKFVALKFISLPDRLTEGATAKNL